MFAVIKSGGRQYKVTVGDKLEVNRLPHEDGKQIEIGEVLLVSDADTALVGAPFVEGAKVLATVVGQKRGEKLIVFKYKSKKRYRHRRGHRQELTVLSIDDIISKGKSLVSGEEPKAEAAPAKAKKETTPTKAKKGTAPAEEVKSETQTAVAEQPVEEKKPRRRSSKKAQESSTEE
ncbi:50S ribosomal protein L21 [Ktedonobacter racemifer]|uniref:Large ribosomal subunit protein bL21 n=1 Tax=Ktedonobacter racemifer DSM 44963 TaxID=485913 RepID=D6TNN8_KTERA|nr:50S ribosomal protein L21 [Ktedonobacter racemifer]EFH87369.1 ribosomal protein L21 [Ktedonobacter racemifer DSM 44963]